ncbi:MAG: hypothetical protein IKZ87_01375 [Actinomycetaceae bacterium]|nr:hypothetical protein [Actinomycetaceae bacterium]
MSADNLFVEFLKVLFAIPCFLAATSLAAKTLFYGVLALAGAADRDDVLVPVILSPLCGLAAIVLYSLFGMPQAGHILGWIAAVAGIVPAAIALVLGAIATLTSAVGGVVLPFGSLIILAWSITLSCLLIYAIVLIAGSVLIAAKR